MANITDIHNPSFVLFPVNNNRTAWRNFGLPVILVVPHKRDKVGVALSNAGVFDLRIYIEDVPREAKVAGHQHIGQRFPDKELYSESVDSLELADRILDLRNLIFKHNGIEIDPADAVTGDIIEYTTSTGVFDTIPYIIGADYYDLSDILLNIELLPSDKYNLVYQTGYFKRVITTDGSSDFLCVNANTSAIAILKFKIDHPGEVIDEFHRLTPPPYLTNAEKSSDTTIALYRPFTDMLQDIKDEQDLLERINWVFDTPPEAVPYLSSLLGWDIPYFPQSLDQLRRAVLRRTVEFQSLKGSRRAIINIFRLFGFEILISNLWWSSDGKRLIRPDERLPLGYQDEEITTISKNQVDLILDGLEITDFTTITAPLLFRPQEKSGLDSFTALRDEGNLAFIVYVVTPNSDADEVLAELANQIKATPEEYGELTGCTESDGFIFPTAIDEALDGLELAGYSQLHISGKLGNAINVASVGPVVPVLADSVHLHRETNNLTFTLNGFSELKDYKIYAFAAYERYEFFVPDVIANLQSNRFDLQVLTQELSEFADPVTLEFAVEFLYKIKAFHSLLNVIKTRIELTETYEVTNLCVGGDFAQRYNTDIGRLQVPPAIIPNIPGDLSDCSLLDPRNLGYKDSDIILRLRKLANLPEEHAAWKALDGRETELPNSLTNIQPTPAAAGRTECKFNYVGQDRLAVQTAIDDWDTENNPTPLANAAAAGIESNSDISPNSDLNCTNSDSSAYGSVIREFTHIREPFCDLDNITDYCYKGRVDDELLYRPTLIGQEYGRIKPIVLGLGIGVYWSYPAFTKMVRPGVSHKSRKSKTNKIRFSGQAPEASINYYKSGIQGEYLGVPYDSPLPRKNNSYLGRLYRDFNSPSQTLHFSNRLDTKADQTNQLALIRPNLEIQKPIMHFPGCRFPTMNRLKADFSSNYEARPWDFAICGPENVCGKTDPDFLNFTMIYGTDGNEHLSFDARYFTIKGNNLAPDIADLRNSSTGTDSDLANDDVVHKVYMSNASSHPAITFDETCDMSGTAIDGMVETNDPLFSSHNYCLSDPTVALDYADGYPCLTGLLSYTPQNFSPYATLLNELGIPADGSSSDSILFLLSSGIRDGSTGLRLDGGCLLAECSLTTESQLPCRIDAYLDQDGLYDFAPDHVEIEARLKFNESINAEVKLLNGSITSLLETIS